MASERRLKVGVLAIGTLVTLAFVGEASYDSWRLHQQIMTANTRELGNLSRSLAAQADRTLQSGDELLVDTVDWARHLAPSARSDGIGAALDKRRGGARQITSLAVYDSTGHLVYLSGRDAAALPDISRLPYFSAQRDASDAGVSIHAPVDNGSVGALLLVLSRRISNADGRFAGVVVATLSLELLRDTYKAIDLGASSTQLLTMADGTLVIRQPTYGNTSRRIRMPELVAMRAGAPITRMISIWDGRPKLIAATGVASWPLILAVQRDEADALRPWVDESRTTAVRTLSLVLATALTMAGALRQLKRSEAAAVALRTSESRYAMAMEAANEGHAEWSHGLYVLVQVNVGSDVAVWVERDRADGRPVVGAG